MWIPDTNIGCSCKLYGFPRQGIVAHSDMTTIDSITITHNFVLGANNYKFSLKRGKK